MPELCLEWIIKSLFGGLAVGYTCGETDVRMDESAVMLYCYKAVKLVIPAEIVVAAFLLAS